MNPHDEQVQAAAQRFYTAHGGEHLRHDVDHLVRRCAQHLAELFCLSDRAGTEAAMQALADMESKGAPGFVDIDRSTSRMVIVHDTARQSIHMVSASELLRLVRQRCLPARAAPAQPRS